MLKGPRLSSLFALLASTSLAAEPQASQQCSVAGKTWTDGFIYLTGQAGVYPSICDNRVATCFRQTRVRDPAGDAIECNEREIHELRRRLGIYASQRDMRWPQAIGCYTYGNSQFSTQQRDVFTKAMDEYHQKTNVKFIPIDQCRAKYGTDPPPPPVCGGCRHSFQFVNGEESCNATLGYDPRDHSVLNCGAGCYHDAHMVVVHELGHINWVVS